MNLQTPGFQPLVLNDTATHDRAGLSRRDVCLLLALGAIVGGETSSAESMPVDQSFDELFALKRRAYATHDAELLRQFYDRDIVVIGEGMKPMLGIETLITAYQGLLPRRRGIDLDILRVGSSLDNNMAYQFVKATALSVDPSESIPVVTFLFLWRKSMRGWRCIVEMMLRQDLSATPGFNVTGTRARGEPR